MNNTAVLPTRHLLLDDFYRPGARATYTDLFDLTQATGSEPGFPNLLAQGQVANPYSTMLSSFPGDGTAAEIPPWWHFSGYPLF